MIETLKKLLENIKLDIEQNQRDIEIYRAAKNGMYLYCEGRISSLTSIAGQISLIIRQFELK